MRKQNVIIVTLTSLFLATGFAACRHGCHRGFDEYDIEAVTNRIAARLDLTDTQKADLKVLTTEIAEKVKEMRSDRETRHREFADLVRQEVVPRETVDQMIAERMEKMQELASFATDRLLKFHATLNEEQREKIAFFIEERASAKRRFFHH